MPVRVVLGEDSLLAREGIMRILEGAEDVELVAACDDLDQLREAIEEHRPDVVLTDIRMPPTNTDEGIRLAGELRSSHPEMAVIVLSQHASLLYALALFEDGASRRGYLLKERLKDQGVLIRALREVANGGALVDPRIVDELAATRSEVGLIDRLTTREQEVLAMIAEGRSNGAIASDLKITKRMVERHINSIFSKLDLGESRDVNRRVRAALVYMSGRRG